MTLTEHRLTIGDGRTVSFTRQGSEAGLAVFYLHGIPGSRHEPRLPAHLARQLQVIAPGRPGVGDSDPANDYSLADHARDILAIADHLQIRHFSLFGFSGGGVFALAAAPLLGERLQKLVISGTPALALLDDPFAEAGELTANSWRQAHDNVDILAEQLQALTGDPETLEQALLESLATPDQRLLRQPSIGAHYRDTLRTALARGTAQAARAIARDTALVVKGRGVTPDAIQIPVRVYHGLEDGLVTHRHAEALARALPRGELILEPGAGHYAGIYGEASEMLWNDLVSSQDLP